MQRRQEAKGKAKAIVELLEKLLDRPMDLVTDKSLTETKARLILPAVQYAARHG
jgi:hypothetical protein